MLQFGRAIARSPAIATRGDRFPGTGADQNARSGTHVRGPGARRRVLRVLIALAVVVGVAAVAGRAAREAGREARTARAAEGPGRQVPRRVGDGRHARRWRRSSTSRRPRRRSRRSSTSLVDSAPGSKAEYTRTAIDARQERRRRHRHLPRASSTVPGSDRSSGTASSGSYASRRAAATRRCGSIHWEPERAVPRPRARVSGSCSTRRGSRAVRSSHPTGRSSRGSQKIVKIGLEPDRIATTACRTSRTCCSSCSAPTPRRSTPRCTRRACNPTASSRSRRCPTTRATRTVLRPKLAPIHGVFFQHSTGCARAAPA